MGNTLFDKIWDSHVITRTVGGTEVLYIDRHLIHEVTSPQAFSGLRKRNLKVRRPDLTVATADHNVPTTNQHLPIVDKLSRIQVESLIANCEEFGIELYGLGHPYQGIVHVIGPELGITQPGMTIVCGDSHTSTHGAFGCVAFGIGTSEVEQVFATQCIIQSKPKTMRIWLEGTRNPGVTAKDLALYMISQVGIAGATGFFVEYAGPVMEALSMEGRMTVCNMSIEMGARGGMVAPDETTFEYVKGKKFAPEGSEFDKQVAHWKTLISDSDAVYDKEIRMDISEMEPMVSYGTDPGMSIGISAHIPTSNPLGEGNQKLTQALSYMGLKAGNSMKGQKIDYVFIGSCTNSRIEDLRAVAQFVKGKQKAETVNAFIVPGSRQVSEQAQREGLDVILKEAGFQLREPGCSACLAMNEDKIPVGKYCISTSNRNFEGRQGPGSRTFLASPLMAAAAAIKGEIVDVREYI